MLPKIIKIDMNVPDKALIEQIERIAANPGADLAQLRLQVVTLAQAIIAVSKHCAGVHDALETIAKNATLVASKKRP